MFGSLSLPEGGCFPTEVSFSFVSGVVERVCGVCQEPQRVEKGTVRVVEMMLGRKLQQSVRRFGYFVISLGLIYPVSRPPFFCFCF
jgi:hypothetical protein